MSDLPINLVCRQQDSEVKVTFSSIALVVIINYFFKTNLFVHIVPTHCLDTIFQEVYVSCDIVNVVFVLFCLVEKMATRNIWVWSVLSDNVYIYIPPLSPFYEHVRCIGTITRYNTSDGIKLIQ